MRTHLPLSILFILTAVSACQPSQGRLCDERAVRSVTVDVSSIFAEPVSSAAVFFRSMGEGEPDADTGPVPFQACEQIGETFGCGFELAGLIEIHVEADGYEEQQHIVDVAQDSCHVVPEHLDIELEPVNCTAEEVPSVILSLVNTAGERITDASAGWGRPDADSAWEPCERADHNLVCGWEQAGVLEIEAHANGYLPWLGTVEVEDGACHVSTRYIEVVLQEETLPCDDEVRPSIVVTVVNAWNTPLPWADTHFVPHLKPLEPWACESGNNGRFFCGEEQAGEFDVIVSADGYYNWVLTVNVPANVCHVETQYIEARLQEWGPIDG